MAPSPIGDISMKKVLITGATGNIGRELRAHLEANGKYALHLLCLSTGKTPTVHTVDLSTFDQDWTAKFSGVDTALHVAADPNPRAGRARIQSRNTDLLLNVMAAAQ
jgi:nucleoside-diphosphate-sugar epimerase